MGFAGSSFTISKRFGLTDTGTTYIIMPEADWENLYTTVCNQVQVPYGIKCTRQASFRFLTAPGIGSMRFTPFQLQIDNVIYDVPFDRFFDVWNDETITLRNVTSRSNPEKLTLGMQFLNVYYQAYDMERN